jgi:proton-dependent oligopeptide transporter, POT family
MPLKNALKQEQRQPKGLYLIFFTGIWERFGFYTLQAIIILYMTKELMLPDHQANLLYAAFSALLYITPIIGGFLADRYLGFQRAIIIGGLLFIAAYILASSTDIFIFYLGLSTLICANGLFKPAISSLVGDLYTAHDTRRDSGFTLFYMGINIGALIPPLISGVLIAKFGWHSGFVIAAAGMIIGQIIFIGGKKILGNAGVYPAKKPNQTPPSLGFYFLLAFGIIFLIGFCQLAFYYPGITNGLVAITAIIILGIVAFFMVKESPLQRKKMLASLILIAISIAFWALYNQTFSSMMLFADRNMNKQLLGFPIDAETTQFFNPFFIILLSPFLSRLWVRMDQVGLSLSIQIKFAMGVLFMSLGFLLFAFGSHFFGVNGMVSPGWICLGYLLQTIGELLLSPIGLAMITVLCPNYLVGMMMGIWFFSQAISFAFSGMLANLAAVPAGFLTTTQSLAIYSHAFTMYGAIGLSMAFISLLLVPFLSYMIKD